MTAIRIEALRKEYGGFVAVAGVDLVVNDGEFLTILGPSGSGKTTLLSMIAGLTEPSTGKMFIGGREVTSEPPQGRNIGLVFQSYALFPHMSVSQNVAFPLDVRKWDKQRTALAVRDALNLMQLGALADRKPAQLSGGQQQRVALARAIVFHPDILLLDEPLGALDRKLREELQVELKQLQRRVGITTLLVTHDQEEALSMADRVMILNDGAVQQLAAPEIAYLQPANRFVAEFLGAANIVSISDGAHGVVRPERIQLGRPGSPGLEGIIRELVYLGQTIRYHIDTQDGLKFVCMKPFVGERFEVADTVVMSWSPSDVWPIG
ncbi:ABC transporter ATP-binding protein [Mesorhizobium sp. M7A.F.Ca.US.006.01.1.1]|uniref:ABC transporter ATP-binding protein n=1 Tax=Mesorhizobium sp. M7A.F.Ca.US.006.01.1.1 TaxID=2496707 RepID=UPI000FCBE8E6|nr:ABC transporter ATP-binding protein [Mesorhizobium sp. M7A.F.Ca.US.006.01.1.1]RUZ75994.1 ABC transporter ATP-binding protein [Mesorhizobium sp. M7A.F.Ca.US.006.01.1.1]